MTVKFSLRILSYSTVKRKPFTPLPVRCCLQSSSQVHEHSLDLLFFVSLRICASGWRGWTLLRASRSVFWRSVDPRTDTALPHPSSTQMTWAVGIVKFPSDTGVQASPEYTSTRPEQGPFPPARRTNPKRNKEQQTQ